MSQQCALAAQEDYNILDMDLLEMGWENSQRARTSCIKRLRKFGWFHSWKKRLQEHLIVSFKHVKEAYKKDKKRLFMKACSNRTEGTGFKLEKHRSR